MNHVRTAGRKLEKFLPTFLFSTRVDIKFYSRTVDQNIGDGLIRLLAVPK
jgi:hypothetical protein